MKKIFRLYCHIMDKKIKNWAFVVFLVVLIIMLVGFFSHQEKSLTHIKTSLYDSYKL